uniref:Uncharacterized protein n=1 Tax=uncultured bacterium fosmid pJB39A3 TaxID=1478063 RepID=A0A0H3U7R2_9BACT|nr:hypothetical protein [uncultured bacterium fosmid pJB39A3]
MRDLHAVSTSDLNKFWYCANMRNGIASTFQEDSGENNIYHGRVFVEMAGDQLTSEDKFKLYIDTSDATGGSIVGDDTGHLLSAARVGLKVEDAEPIIIHFEDGDAKSDINTKVDGQLVEAGQVIGPNGQTVTDPSEELDEYQLDSSEDPIAVPNKSIATLTANEPVQIDVYFYLEGCDPNCIEDIETNEAKLHLAFYAIAE